MRERESRILAGFVQCDRGSTPSASWRVQRTWTQCFSVCIVLSLAACGVDQPSQEAGDPPVPTTGNNQINPDVGGSVKLADGPTVNIPEGALPAGREVAITVVVVSSDEMPSPEGAESPVWELGPVGTVFEAPVSVELPFELGDRSPDDYTVAWSTLAGTDFEDVPTHFEAGKATALVDHLGRGFVRKHGQPAGPDAAAPTACADCADADADADDKACSSDSACASGSCSAGVCAQVPSCTDGVKNGIESDVDCGGSCADCVDGKACLFSSDCASNSCVGAVCTRVASCTDRVKNGSETDVDCGGSCANCTSGKACLKDDDCASGGCSGGRCLQVPLCTDGVKNGDETDVDCGGSCAHCSDGKACLSSSDCASGECAAGLCAQASAAPVLAASSCTDDVKNGDESDVDCGGRCPVCLDWKHCLSAVDCASGGCDQGWCTPATQ